MNKISWSDFEKVEIRAGTVVEVKEFPEPRKPAFQLMINFGEEIGIKQASAQIRDLYSADELIGPFISECLLTGLYREDATVVLTVPDRKVQNGARLG